MSGFTSRINPAWGRVVLRTAAVAGVCAAMTVGIAIAQNPFAPSPGVMDTLNEGSAGASGAGNIAKNKAAGLAANPNALQPGALAGLKGGKAQLKEAATAATRVFKPRVKAIMGTRVFDNVTGELLDDAQLVYVDPAEIGNLGLVDDGNKGDPVANDGQFANVETSREFIGQSNQRLKERLIQAIYSAEQLTPLEFFGFDLMTTERHNPAPRNRSWKLVADANGGHGLRLAEVASDKPLQVPKFREWEQERDKKISGKDGWAMRFLDEYRKEKGSIESEFYPILIPQPPAMPGVAPPPVATGWHPFPNPGGPKEGKPGAPGGQFSKYGYKIKDPGEGTSMEEMNAIRGGAGAAKPYFNSKNMGGAFR